TATDGPSAESVHDPPRKHPEPPRRAISQQRPATNATSPRRSFLAADSVQNTLSFMVSMMVHLVILVALGLLLTPNEDERHRVALVVAAQEDDEEPSLLEPMLAVSSFDSPEAESEKDDPQLAQVPNAPNIPSPFARQETASVVQPASRLARQIPLTTLMLANNAPVGGGFEGRTQEARARLAATGGATPHSEAAVEAGLAWLAAHQRADGSWRLLHQFGTCDCRNQGVRETSTGATGLGLLPFLGAGYTHLRGPYHEVVQKGLDYLMCKMVDTPHGGDLQEGGNIGMYTHGIAALALCEAYAMTGDQQLRPYAEKTIQFICTAQHSQGGWRYNPGQPGDTTVSGWQVMALKSGRLARLELPSHVIERTKLYLNSVSTSQGAFYGYRTPRKEVGPTAVALLLRMYLGWTRDDDRLVRGSMYLSATGPSRTDVYFNYYATQVMHHLQGNGWPQWNARMRDYLVETQAKREHEKGSWFFPDPHGTYGGRLYTTAMCIMTLEVYYRHMPLYGDDAVIDDF
ncbi:MAG: terpene cyclase/mutase family protein, partial [Pirellulaceae bacterium]|nr:terpene cyclase/mutase family protein [Pirellulaceae bacterium]